MGCVWRDCGGPKGVWLVVELRLELGGMALMAWRDLGSAGGDRRVGYIVNSKYESQ